MTPTGEPFRPSRRGWGLLAIGGWALAGCEGKRTQSALHPAGPAADAVADIWWLMLGLGAAVFVLVIALAALAVGRRRTDRPPMGSKRFIVTFGLVLPSIILVYLLFEALRTTVALRVPPTAHTIEVVGHQWWWEVRYPEHGVTTANQIHIPTGEPVLLRLRSNDVIHSFWVPELQGKLDLVPEVTNTFWIQADRPGIYRGQCAEFCGLQHARMAFLVVAEEPADFQTWLRAQARDADPTPELQPGLDIFMATGCANCHAIRGTAADPGEVGPDLTHFGERLTIGAGTRPNTTGDLAGWIANPQAIKPGNRMPPTYLEPRELDTLVSFLQSLR